MMQTPDYFNVINDFPKKEMLSFGFEGYAITLAETITHSKNDLPFTLGIYGAWGSGKTSLMEGIKRLLEDDYFYEDPKLNRRCKAIWFDAWKNETTEDLFFHLITAILKKIKSDDHFIKKLKSECRKFMFFKKSGKAMKHMARKFLSDKADSFLRDELFTNETLFWHFFERLIAIYTGMCSELIVPSSPDHSKGALVVFMDDLDQCSDIVISDMLESIRHYLDKTGCILIFSGKEHIIQKAFEQRYEVPEDGLKFLDKMVPLTFTLPSPTLEEFKSFLYTIAPKDSETIGPFLEQVLETTHYNIRAFKNFLNSLYLEARLNINKNTGIDLEKLLLWKTLIRHHPELLRKDTGAVVLIQERVRELSGFDGYGSETILNHIDRTVSEISLHSYIKNQFTRSLFEALNLTKSQINWLKTIGKTIKINDLKVPEYRYHTDVIDDERSVNGCKMVPIEKGPFLYGRKNEDRVIEKAYKIDIYPVTRAQFAGFINNNGYGLKVHWSDEGWRWLKEHENDIKIENEYRLLSPFDHPIVNITLHEAQAYASWSKKRLPTEVEWERAARGVDGRVYPWGDAFDSNRCNSQESGELSTSRVSRFPNGISPSGCYDMAGNTWEWTIPFINNKKDYILKGGSCYDNQAGSMLMKRVLSSPEYKAANIGFRCVKDKMVKIKKKSHPKRRVETSIVPRKIEPVTIDPVILEPTSVEPETLDLTEPFTEPFEAPLSDSNSEPLTAPEIESKPDLTAEKIEEDDIHLPQKIPEAVKPAPPAITRHVLKIRYGYHPDRENRKDFF